MADIINKIVKMLLYQKIQGALGSRTGAPWGPRNLAMRPVTSFGNYPMQEEQTFSVTNENIDICIM